MTLRNEGDQILREGGVFDMIRLRWFMGVIVSLSCLEIIAVQPVVAQPPEKASILAKSPLLNPPKTPEEVFAAIVLMVDLGRMDLAEKYLEQFDEAAPGDDLLIALRDKYGTGEFLRLAQIKELQPRSTSLLERMNAAARKQADDPAYVDSLIQRLIQEPKKRDLTIVELRNAGVRAVPEILKQLAKPEMDARQDLLILTLRQMGNQIVPPLIGAIDSPVERIQAAIIETLGSFNAREAVPYLWFPAFDDAQPDGVRNAARRTLARLLKGSPERAQQLSSVQASNELRRLAQLLYRQPDALSPDEDGNVKLWSWSDEAGTVVEQSMAPDIAAVFVSTRFARQSLALSPEIPEVQIQYLASLLALETLRAGWDKPRLAPPGSAMYLALTAGEETVAKVLAEALVARQSATAVPALEILGQTGSREQLLSQVGMRSPVLAALNSPDPRVQFAAATAVLKLDPFRGFRGSNRVVEILSRSMTDPGRPIAVVIDTDGARANTVTGFLTDGGYDGIATTTGRAGFEQAAMTAGVNLIAVHVNCARWDLNQTLANLRADSRTAAIPIVIYGPADLSVEKERLVRRHAPAVYAAEAATSSDFIKDIMPLVASQKSTPLSPRERDLQKQASVYWMATIATGNGGLSRVFDISKSENELGNAVEDPDVALNALIALSGIGTASSQRRLADVALNANVAEGIRQVAANQLTYHIQHHRLLLSRDDVIKVHEGWQNAENPVVKSALAGVIGAFRPNATVVGERLQHFPVPTASEPPAPKE